MSPPGAGTITPASGLFDPGNVVITATPATDFLFSGFSGALTGTANPQTLNLTAASSVTANFVIDPATIPTAAATAANVTAPGGTSHTVTVTYADNSGIHAGTIGTGDVTVSGPGGFVAAPALVSTDGANPVIATYSMTPPGGTWDVADAGTYTITMIANEVFDVSSNPVPEGPIGSFDVFPPIPITVTTNPEGLGVIVDGVGYTSPQTFQWPVTSTHTIETTTPQIAGPSTQHVFESWSDGGLVSHGITVSAPTTFTAQFKPQYLLTTAASPIDGGSISPASGYFDSGIISATPNAGFYFTGFSGAVTGTTNPQPFSLTGPASVTANFVRSIPSVIESRIGASSDDAEESSSGAMSLSSGDLELVYDGSLQKVGLRFAGLAIPRGARITRAWVQFAARESHSEATVLAIRAQATSNAAAFTSSSRNISLRTPTLATVPWNLSATPWLAGQAGAGQQTPDLTSIVQEIVDRDGWASGNALALIITGTGHRTAWSYDGSKTLAPLLHVEFETNSDPNRAPIVDAGLDQTITMPTSIALLDGTVSDDGLPRVPGALITTWTATGPAAVAFTDLNAVDTQASFTAAGAYLLRLTATDGEKSAYDSVTVNVLDGAPATLERRVAAQSDDAEESASGSVSLSSSDLELVDDGSLQKVGIRFANLTIPRGATITRAFVRFRAKEAQSVPTSVVFQCEASDNAPTFTGATRNVSTRARTTGTPAWTPGPWAVGANHDSPELKDVIQQVVGRAGWKSGNALVLIATGTGHRTAYAFDGSAAAAPLLHVEFTTGGTPVNLPPTVNAGPGHTITMPPGSVLLDATVADDGLPTPAAPGVTWSVDSGLGTVAFSDEHAVDTRATFGQVGVYVLRLTATDGLASTSDSVTIHVQSPPGSAIVVERRGAASSDDAEENASGSVSLSSSDLELLYDSSLQTVGMRFPNLAIPRGAQILTAYVQFTAKEIQSEATAVTLQGEASDNAAPFTTATRNLSTRGRTVESVLWSPIAPWNTVGVAGTAQQTADLSSVIQRIVGRPGWASGNAIALIATGTGHRTPYSWDGDRTRGPLLHVEYTTAPAAPARLTSSSTSEAIPDRTTAWVAPNPFRGSGTLLLSLARSGDVTLSIFDIQGRRIGGQAVFAGLNAGRHPLQLGSGTAGGRLEAGLYFYQLTAPGAALNGRFLVVQ